MLGTIAGWDERDSTSVDEPVPDYVAKLDEPVGKMRIGLVREYAGEGLNPETRRAVEMAIEVYRGFGAEVREIHMPIGLQLMASHFAEDRLLQIAHRFQQATDHHRQKPPVCTE